MSEILSKVCLGCQQDLPLDSYNKLKSGKFGRHPRCSDCRKKDRKRPAQDRPPEGTLVKCSNCKEELDQSLFSSDRSSYNGLQGWCRACQKIRFHNKKDTVDLFIGNLFKDLKKNAKRRDFEVEITKKDIKNLYHGQEGLCAITKKKLTYISGKGNGRGNNPDNISVDRIDSNRGYSIDNIHLVTTVINSMKQEHDMDKFLAMHEKISHDKELSQPVLKKKLNFKPYIKKDDPKKKCRECSQEKVLTEFHISKSGELGRHPYCKECRKAMSKARANNNRPPEGTIVHCNTCNRDLDQSLFSTATRRANGLQIMCKECKSKDQAEKWSTLNGFLAKLLASTRVNARNRNIKFSINLDDIKELYNLQQGKCRMSNINMTHISQVLGDRKKVKHPENISIDRIDSKGYYTRDNIQLICNKYNRSKWDIDQDIFIENSRIIATLDKGDLDS